MKTLRAYYFAKPLEGGYMEVCCDDGEPLRAETRGALMERLDEAKEIAGPPLFIVKETITAEEITE